MRFGPIPAVLACLLVIGLALPVPASAQSPPQASPQHIELVTSDQYRVSALYWEPTQSPAPGVVLVHMRGSNKESWGDFGAKLVEEGFAAIAIDLRGHGQTTGPGGRQLNLNDLTDLDYQYMLRDIEAAHNFLDEQGKVDANRIAIIGASIGANLGIMYASYDKRVRTVVALSPGLDYHSLKPMEYLGDYGRRALYLIGARGDEYAYDSCEALMAAATESDPVSFRPFDGKEHGTDLLTAHPGLDMTIISGWLLNHLPPER